MNIKIIAALLLAAILASCHKPRTVLILGNSITIHAPSPAIGWNNNWGMAASMPDSDYVHLLIDSIHAKDPSAIVKIKEVGEFERDFEHYNLAKLDTLRSPYLLIMHISENVDDDKALKKNFISHYDGLIKRLDPQYTVVADGFWNNRYVNAALKKYALDNDLPYIEISDLSADSTNRAIGKYANPGIQAHPSDKGMRLIKDRIWSSIQFYF